MAHARDNFFFRHMTQLAFLLLTLFASVAGIMFYQQDQASNTARTLLLHTYEVTGHIQLLFNRLKDVELGQRGYMIAGDEQYLAPYNDALKPSLGADATSNRLEQHHSIGEEMAILRKLTADSSMQQQNLDEMDNIIKELLDYWALDIQMRHDAAAGNMPVNPDFQKENQLTDQLRKLVAIMMATENNLLEQRTKIAQSSIERNNALTISGIVLFYTIVGIAILMGARLLNQKFQAQYDLKNQKELLEKLIEALPIPLIAKDVKDDYRFMLWNAKAEELIGIPRQKILGSTDYDHFSKAEADKFRLADKQAMESRQIVDIPLETVMGAHGPWLSHTRKVPIYDEQDTPSILFGILEDITERNAIDRLKNEFISTVSHELRTPLTSVRGSLGLMLSGIGGDLSDKGRNLINIAYKNCERLILLINDILDIEKIESGQMHFEMGIISVRALLEQAVELNKPYGDKFGIQLVVASQIPEVSVVVDSARFMQIMSNLLSNAVKFSPTQGIVHMGARVQNNQVEIFVTDHGSGIPDSFKSRVFGKFAQADGSDTKSKGGTGLGLNIAKSMIEHMGGTIGFSSALQQGTTFTLVLPIANTAQHILPTHPIEEANNKILICENDESSAEFLKAILEKEGFTVNVAFTVQQADKLLLAHSYAAMTLDPLFSDKDGLEYLRKLRDRKNTRTLPIIVISVKSMENTKGKIDGAALGIVDWLVKPIDTSRLAEALKQLRIRGSMPLLLHVEDDNDIAQITALNLQGIANIIQARTLKEASLALRNNSFDLVLLDIALPDGSGLKLLESLNSAGGKPIPVIILSASELLPEASRKVAAALVKAKTTDAEIISAIVSLIRPDKYTIQKPVSFDEEIKRTRT